MEITNEIMELFRPAYGAERETIAAEGFQWEINWILQYSLYKVIDKSNKKSLLLLVEFLSPSTL